MSKWYNYAWKRAIKTWGLHEGSRNMSRGRAQPTWNTGRSNATIYTLFALFVYNSQRTQLENFNRKVIQLCETNRTATAILSSWKEFVQWL